MVQRKIGGRARHGLGSWAVRSASDHAFVGVGGVDMTAGGVWNLGYRLAPAAWGQGFASEIALAAVRPPPTPLRTSRDRPRAHEQPCLCSRARVVRGCRWCGRGLPRRRTVRPRGSRGRSGPTGCSPTNSSPGSSPTPEHCQRRRSVRARRSVPRALRPTDECVAMSTAAPSPPSSASRSSTIAAFPSSRALVGSSARMTDGRFTRSLAIATRCCSPPLSSWTRSVARPVRPTRSRPHPSGCLGVSAVRPAGPNHVDVRLDRHVGAPTRSPGTGSPGSAGAGSPCLPPVPSPPIHRRSGSCRRVERIDVPTQSRSVDFPAATRPDQADDLPALPPRTSDRSTVSVLRDASMRVRTSIIVLRSLVPRRCSVP